MTTTAVDRIPHAAEKIADLEANLPELEQAMSYSLADAIREGSTVTGQCVGNWHDTEGNVCALSAALLAVKARRML
ncbi:MAG TPA: hypothetical protein VFN75_10610 [Pseudonocardiaceae bacterium]|nr:hypothetical protein [Pseudonocardiaceae bacterium]